MLVRTTGVGREHQFDGVESRPSTPTADDGQLTATLPPDAGRWTNDRFGRPLDAQAMSVVEDIKEFEKGGHRLRWSVLLSRELVLLRRQKGLRGAAYYWPYIWATSAPK